VFKKLITLMMVLSIFSTQANAASQNSLKAAFDELNYAMAVEWDQQDKDFYQAQMQKFSNEIRSLQAEGLTNEELIAFVKSEIKDAKTARDMETAFNMISINKMSSEEASKYMLDSMKRSYAVGASWNGEILIYVGVAVLIVAVAVILSNSSSGSSYSGGGGGYYCRDRYICDTQCYYDYYYGYTCYEDCYWTCY
jgi:uncharacterized protein YoaH (UPF0181 family)